MTITKTHQNQNSNLCKPTLPNGGQLAIRHVTTQVSSFIIHSKPEFTAWISHLFRWHENPPQYEWMGQVVPKNWPCSTCHQHVYMNQYKVGCMIVLNVSRTTKEQIHTSMFKKSTDMATIVSHKDKNSSTLRGKDRLSYLGHVLGDILYVAMLCNSIWYPLLASQHVMKCWSTKPNCPTHFQLNAGALFRCG